MKDFVAGVKYFFRGFKTVLRPGLRPYLILPLVIGTLVYTSLIWFAVSSFGTLMTWLLPTGEAWYWELLGGLLWVIFAVLILIILFFTFVMVMNILASPFNGFLAEKVEIKVCGAPARELTWGQRLHEFGVIFLGELKKYAYFLMIAVILLVITMIPVIHVVSPVLWFLFGSWMLAAEYIAYPMNNHGKVFKEVRKTLQQHRMLTYGLGMAAFVLFWIPVLNFFVMPAAVTGGTLLWYERIRK